ncbi:MAG: Coenzyme F420 hydrogenase/dehydrogenase, beta subunit C-terminal domain [Acidimicrobiales bacterium]
MTLVEDHPAGAGSRAGTRGAKGLRAPLGDPAADLRDEIAVAGGMPELPDKIWFHKTAAAVIDAERCVGCGGCIAACPSSSIGVAEDGKPTLVKMCTGCSACWDYCPLAGLKTEALHAPASGAGDETAPANGAPGSAAEDGTAASIELGRIDSSWSVAGRANAAGVQDGGAVTALLCQLLATGFLDGAIVTRRVDAFRGEPFLATSPDEVRAAAGSVYHQSHPLKVLNEPLGKGVERIAFVGTPCQISVLRALQRFPWKYRRSSAGAVVLAIGLFCTRSFDPDALEEAVGAVGVTTSKVARVDVRDGELVVRSASTELLRRPVKELYAAGLKGCDECADFTGLGADLAVGNLASEPGRSTVLVRTQAGRDAWAAATGALDVRPLEELTPVVRTAARDRRRAVRSLARPFDPEGPLWTSYTEHLDLYEDTARSVQAPAEFRSHHFEVTC